jgi:hypothetical protein
MLIQDLSYELDTKTMTGVRGGDNGNSANNTICQQLNICAPVSVMGYGPSNTSVNVNGTQNAAIGNEQFAGDSYLAALFPASFGGFVR